MRDDRLNAEESAALLHVIFPNYPDLQGMNSAPEIEAFLRIVREGSAACSNRLPSNVPAH